MTRLSLLLLAFAACDPAKPGLDDTAAPADDTAVDTDTDTADDTDSGPSDPTIADLAVTVHPEVATVLVATWTQRERGDTWLSWELDGETYASPVTTTEAGPATAYVFGLPADTVATVTLHGTAPGAGESTDAATLSVEATTGPLPENLVAPTLTLATPDADPAPYLLTSVDVGPQNFFGPCYVVILDRSGRVVWYHAPADRRLTLFPRVARGGGHLYWDATTYYTTGTPSITRATLSLRDVEEVEVPGMGFTWDETPDGAWIYDEAASPYDYHLARRDADGTTTRLWSCAPWMAPYSTDYWACAANTALWDDATGTVIWSMFQTSTVLGLDPTTGTVLWELGEYPGGLGFDPEDVRLELQHYPNPTPDGTVLLTTHVPGRREQHIREFALDGATATQVWDYTADGYYGDYAGEATRLPGGNTLINFGTDGVLREVTPARDVAWELDWGDHLVGHLTPLDDLYALDIGR